LYTAPRNETSLRAACLTGVRVSVRDAWGTKRLRTKRLGYEMSEVPMITATITTVNIATTTTTTTTITSITICSRCADVQSAAIKKTPLRKNALLS